MAENIMNKLGLFGSNVPGLLDKGLANLYDRDALIGLENRYGNQYGLQQTGTGIGSDARHMAAMNNLSNTLSKSGLGIAMGLPSEFAGDIGAFGAGLINEIPALARGFNKQNLGEIGEDIKANYAGSFGTPNSTTAEDIYSQIFTGAVPQRVASGTPMGYGAAQASDLTDLERDFPGMSTGDIIDSMNNRGPARAANDLSGLDMDRFEGVSNLGRNDMDVEQVEQLGSPSRFQGFKNSIGSGLGSIRDFAIDKGRMGRNLIGSAGAMALGLPGIVGSLLSNFGDGVDYQQYTPGFDYKNLNPSLINDFYNPKTGLNRFDRARKKGNTFASSRTLAEYFEKRKVKKAAEAQAKQAAREAATAARAMARNPQVYSNAGITSGGFASQNTGTNQGFSNKSGRGRTGYSEGGVASMFTRRG